MKKILLIVLLLFPMIQVSAETYYSPYYESDQEHFDIPEDLLEVEEEKQYLWYRLKRDGNYFLYGKNDPEYLIQTDFWKYDNWSQWSKSVPLENEHRQIEMRKVYYYQMMKQISWIKLSEIETDDLLFSGIQIYKNHKRISFESSRDGNTFLISLSEPCYMEELEIVFTLEERSNEEKHFKIQWLYDLDSPVAMENYTRFWFQGFYQVSYQYRNMAVKNLLWNDPIKSLDKVETNMHQQVQVEEEYRYREKLYYYEKETKEYDFQYRTIGTNEYPYKDQNTEKIVKKIKVRDKIHLPDLVVLKEKIELESLIESTIPYQISSNINWNESGIYQIILDTSFGVFKKDIYLDLPLVEPVFKIEKVEKVIEKPSQIIVKEKSECVVVKEECKNVEKQLTEANATIMSLENESSTKKEKEANKKIPVQKQSMIPFSMLTLFLFILGIIIGRIMANKKKF